MPALIFARRVLLPCCSILMAIESLAAQQTLPLELASLHPETVQRLSLGPTLNSTASQDSMHHDREWLAEKGVDFSFSYTAEAFSNLTRDVRSRRGAEYMGSIDSTIQLNLHKLGFGRGKVVLSAQSLHGRNVNDARIGALQKLSNLDNGPFSKVMEAYYSDSYLGGRLQVKLGRQYADADFNAVENAGDFLNASYGQIPTVPLPAYPSPDTGASVWTKPLRWLSVGAGIYRGSLLGAPEPDSAPLRKGSFAIAELRFAPHSSTAAFHGVYRFGVWRQSRGAWTAHEGTTRPLANAGVYATSDHWFRKSNSAGQNSGPGVFLQAGWAPANRNQVTAYFGGGLSWQGLIGRRPQDSIGVGITQAKLSISGRETVTEMFYRWHVLRRMAVQPDVQWVRRPCGAGHSSLVGGLRLLMEL